MKSINKKIIENKKGISLIELLVAVTIFSVLVLMATQIFQTVVEGQRSAIAAQNLQESTKYLLEVMSKEIRTAQGYHSGKDCGVPSFPPYYKVFNTNVAGTDANELYFENKNGDCVAYQLWDDDRIYIKRGSSDFIPVTPSKVRVTSLLFNIDDDLVNAFHSQQARVTVVMDVEVIGKEMHKQAMKLQTTISSRFYE